MHRSRQKIVIRVEDNYGCSAELRLDSLRQVLLYVEQKIEKVRQGTINSILMFMECPREGIGESEIRRQFKEQNNPYDIELLKEQLLLFDRQQDMMNFIETEKVLAENCVQQLTQLSFSLMRLSKQLVLKKKPVLDFSLKQESITRQKLDQIQSECLAVLARVREERKRIEACCICLQRKSNTVILPCMHLALCKFCGGPLARCPICMQPISQMRQIFQ